MASIRSLVAFTNTHDDGIYVWVCDVATGQAQQIGGIRLNAVLTSPMRWMPD